MKPTNDRWSEQNKCEARLAVVEVWKRLSGRRSIPKGRSYISLCGEGGGPMSEVRSLCDSGLIAEGQFVGINGKQAIIDDNAKLFPLARFVRGSWLRELGALAREPDWNPAIVNADTQSVAGVEGATALAAGTLNIVSSTCLGPVLVAFNAMMSNPWSGETIPPGTFERSLWGLLENERMYGDRLPSYTYRMGGKRTVMETHFFWIDPRRGGRWRGRQRGITLQNPVRRDTKKWRS